jgi:hypothetical protein
MKPQLSKRLIYSLPAVLALCLSACNNDKPAAHQHINPDGYELILNFKHELFYLKNEPEMYFINGSYYHFDKKWFHCRNYKEKCSFPDKLDMPDNILKHYHENHNKK